VAKSVLRSLSEKGTPQKGTDLFCWAFVSIGVVRIGRTYFAGMDRSHGIRCGFAALGVATSRCEFLISRESAISFIRFRRQDTAGPCLL
jgi:hypothetical protein